MLASSSINLHFAHLTSGAGSGIVGTSPRQREAQQSVQSDRTQLAQHTSEMQAAAKTKQWTGQVLIFKIR
jgi:hypothetical protein